MLLLLEDNPERVQRFTETVRTIDPRMPLLLWSDAWTMIREIGQHLRGTRLMSLDHDLDSCDKTADPGDGLEVVKFLVSQPVTCPVIIHTSNFEGCNLMAAEFERAGWSLECVPPIGDDWIEVDWKQAVKRLLRKSKEQKWK